MKKLLDYTELAKAIKKVYVAGDKYQLNKHVPTFQKDGTYVGDFFNFTMMELDGNNPPIFYHNYSPYDVISGKSTDHAVVLRSGEVIMSTVFTPYMQQRTGVMTSVVLKALGTAEVETLKVLYIGTGSIACCDLAALKAHYPILKQITYINRSGVAEDFVKLAGDIGVECINGKLDHISEFDVIICHTDSKEPVLTSAMKDKIKLRAVIMVYSSEDFTEVATEYFDTDCANLIIDWEQTIEEAPELKQAVDNGQANRDKIITLEKLFAANATDKTKKYTIYRTHGTPIQNLAAMQLLMQRAQPSTLSSQDH